MINIKEIIKIKLSLLALTLASSAGAGSLREFPYNPDPNFLRELSARVGCEAASQWVVQPAAGAAAFQQNLKLMISESMLRADRSDRNRSWTALTKKYLFDSAGIAKACAGSVSTKQMGSGLAELSDLAPDGLVIFTLGGFGSHLGSEGTLTTSMKAWGASHKSLFDSGKIRYERVECSFSFASDQSLCADDMRAKINTALNADSQAAKKKIMLWGYSKGGISALNILARDAALRAKTIAVVSIGAPLQGSQIMDRMVPALDAFVASAAIPGTTMPMGADTVLQMLRLWLGHSSESAGAVMARFPEALEGARSMTTASRAALIKDELKPGALARPDGSKINVFQIAGVVDPDRLNGVPELTVKNGRLVPKAGSSDNLHAGETAALVAATDHPLSDTCVALEDSVLPLSMAEQAGLTPSLVAIARVDHLALRLHRQPGDVRHGVPDHAITDSVFSTVAASLKRAGR